MITNEVLVDGQYESKQVGNKNVMISFLSSSTVILSTFSYLLLSLQLDDLGLNQTSLQHQYNLLVCCQEKREGYSMN